MKKRYIAMKMEKIELDNGRNIFFPVKKIIGELDEEKKFKTLEAKYTFISDPSAKNETFIYANPIELEKLDILFPNFENITEKWDAYERQNLKFFYYQNYINGEPTAIVYEKEKLLELLDPSLVTRETITPEMKEKLEQAYSTFLELINMIDLDKMDSKEITAIKEKIKTLNKTMKAAEVSARIKTECIASEEKVKDMDLIYGDITKTLISQDEPARRVIVEISRLNDMRKKNYGILLTGSSGVGKTLLMSLIAKNIDKPLLTIDSTQLTMPGYVGKNIEQYLWELYEKCDKNIDKAEHSIIFFDEIDKKGSSDKSDVAGQGVLNTLLKFLDGETYTASKNPQSQTNSTTININTENMIIVCGGAFLDVYKNKDKNSSIGFTKNEQDKEENPTIEDFITSGQMPKEFMGRLPVIIKLNDLDIEGLKKILLESIDSPLKIQEEVFKDHGVKLSTKQGYIKRVAEKAISYGTGARALNKIITDSTWNAYYDVCCNNGSIEEVVLTEETVDNPKSYQLIKKNK